MKITRKILNILYKSYRNKRFFQFTFQVYKKIGRGEHYLFNINVLILLYRKKGKNYINER